MQLRCGLMSGFAKMGMLMKRENPAAEKSHGEVAPVVRDRLIANRNSSEPLAPARL